jgi:hypothetical protein
LAHRLLHVLWILILFELGVLLLFLPWFGLWDNNYFVSHYPFIRPYLLHPAMRGAVSGLGALDIFLAAGMLRRPKNNPASPHTDSRRNAQADSV